MEYAQNVRVVNISNQVSPKLKKGFDNSKYPRIDPGGSKIVPWSTAVLWCGDPDLIGRMNEMEESRIRAFYGCIIEDSQMDSCLPHFEVYDLETGDRVPTVCDRLLGIEFEDSQAGEPEDDQKFIIAELRRLRAENQQFAEQLSAVMHGKSVRSADVVTPADETEPEPVGVTSADSPQMAKTGRKA